jgi:hypothetical protein
MRLFEIFTFSESPESAQTKPHDKSRSDSYRKFWACKAVFRSYNDDQVGWTHQSWILKAIVGKIDIPELLEVTEAAWIEFKSIQKISDLQLLDEEYLLFVLVLLSEKIFGFSVGINSYFKEKYLNILEDKDFYKKVHSARRFPAPSKDVDRNNPLGF